MTPSDQSYATISLTRGQVALVDAADFEWISKWKWCAQLDPTSGNYYAGRGEYLGGGRKNRKIRTVKMHRLILGLEQGEKMQGDHINGNTLDNRRSNLRICTSQQNSWNTKRSVRNKSGFKGVTWYARDRKWRAVICVNGKIKSLGLHDSPNQAHEAYCAAGKQYYGEFFHP